MDGGAGTSGDASEDGESNAAAQLAESVANMTLNDSVQVTAVPCSQASSVSAVGNSVAAASNLIDFNRKGDHLRAEKRGNVGAWKGDWYEYKMASLMFLRGVNRTADFCMWMNINGIGTLDDLIFKYRFEGENNVRLCFVQLKHRPKEKFSFNAVTDKNISKDYSLVTHYDSYILIKGKVGDETKIKRSLFDVKLDDCDFILHTCAEAGPTVKLVEDFLLTKRQRKLIKMFATKEKGVGNRSLCFSADQIAGITSWSESKMTVMTSMGEFIPRMQLFTQQLTEDDLNTLIRREIKEALGTRVNDTKEIAAEFIANVQDWWKETGSPEGIHKESQFWKIIIASRFAKMNDMKKRETDSLKIRFSDITVERFYQSLSGILVNVTSEYVKLTSLKIFQALEKYHSQLPEVVQRFIFVTQAAMLERQSEVLCAWKSMWCDVLVIESSCLDQQLADKLFTISRLPDKKLILLSQSPLSGYEQHELQDNFEWSDLERSSQNTLLARLASSGCPSVET